MYKDKKSPLDDTYIGLSKKKSGKSWQNLRKIFENSGKLQKKIHQNFHQLSTNFSNHSFHRVHRTCKCVSATATIDGAPARNHSQAVQITQDGGRPRSRLANIDCLRQSEREISLKWNWQSTYRPVRRSRSRSSTRHNLIPPVCKSSSGRWVKKKIIPKFWSKDFQKKLLLKIYQNLYEILRLQI